MICPKCSYEQPDGGLECVGCGVIFAKIRDTTAFAQPSNGEGEAKSFDWRDLLLPELTEVNPIALAFRAILWLVLVIWGGQIHLCFGGVQHHRREFSSSGQPAVS